MIGTCYLILILAGSSMPIDPTSIVHVSSHVSPYLMVFASNTGSMFNNVCNATIKYMSTEIIRFVLMVQ